MTDPLRQQRDAQGRFARRESPDAAGLLEEEMRRHGATVETPSEEAPKTGSFDGGARPPAPPVTPGMEEALRAIAEEHRAGQ
jgi:hypothetical protein